MKNVVPEIYCEEVLFRPHMEVGEDEQLRVQWYGDSERGLPERFQFRFLAPHVVCNADYAERLSYYRVAFIGRLRDWPVGMFGTVTEFADSILAETLDQRALWAVDIRNVLCRGRRVEPADVKSVLRLREDSNVGFILPSHYIAPEVFDVRLA